MSSSLLFESKAFLKLMEYARGVKTEICGVGRIEKDQFGISRVTDIAIMPQEVGGVDANVTASDMEAFFQTIPEENREEWCFNWHTHPTFSTNPSGTDLSNYKNMGELFDIFVPMIVSHAGEYSAFVYHSQPINIIAPVSNIFIYELREHVQKFSRSINQKDQIPFIESILSITGAALTAEEKAVIFDEITQKVSQRAAYYWGGSYQPYAANNKYSYGNYQHYDRRGNNKNKLNRHPHVLKDFKRLDFNRVESEKIIIPGEVGKKKEKKSLLLESQIEEINACGWTEDKLLEHMASIGYEYDKSWQCFLLVNVAEHPSSPETLSVSQAISMSLKELIEIMDDVDYEWIEDQGVFVGEGGLSFTVDEAIAFVETIKECPS